MAYHCTGQLFYGSMRTISLPNNTKKNKRTAHHHGWRNILVLLSTRLIFTREFVRKLFRNTVQRKYVMKQRPDHEKKG